MMTSYPESRRYVRISPSVHGTTNVVNYAADNNELNGFLRAFDAWRSKGQFKLSDDKNYQEVWFEMHKEFYELAKTLTMRIAFERFGVKVVFD